MRHAIGAFAALMLGVVLVSPALGQTGPRTVSDYYDEMTAVAARLEAQLSEKQRIGDMAAAQRLQLAAAMTRRVAAEFRGAEQESMLYEVTSLSQPIPARADAALETAHAAETESAKSGDYFDSAQKNFNALLAALPIKNQHPVVYGMLVNDLAEPTKPLPSDVLFFGYHILDPEFHQNPVLIYSRKELPAADVKVDNDRIEVRLPDEVRKAINFAPPPCESRQGFSLRVAVPFSEPRGIWPFIWHSENLSNLDFYALPTPVIYSATVVTSSQGSSTSETTQPLFGRSGLITTDCENSRSAEVKVPVPVEARSPTCTAAWADTTGASKVASRCKIENGVAHATGEIAGGSKVCSPDKLCTCAAPAQGWLEARGNYQVSQTNYQMKTDESGAPVSFPAGGLVEERLAAGSDQKLRHIALKIRRLGCPALIDTIDVNVGDEVDGEGQSPSKNGAFRAVVRGGQLWVGAADAITSDARKGY